jgi:hypothetical protein
LCIDALAYKVLAQLTKRNKSREKNMVKVITSTQLSLCLQVSIPVLIGTHEQFNDEFWFQFQTATITILQQITKNRISKQLILLMSTSSSRMRNIT